MEIYKIMVMSTAHLTEQTFLFLNGGDYSIAYVNDEGFGTIVRFTDSDLEDEDLPEDLMRCLKFASENDCDYVRFDGDGTQYDLPIYDW